MINKLSYFAVYNLLFIANCLLMCARLYSERVAEGKKKAPRVLSRETTRLPECVRIYATGVVGAGRMETAWGGD